MDRVLAAHTCRCGRFLRITDGYGGVAIEHHADSCPYVDEADFEEIIANVPDTAWLDPPLSRETFIAKLEQDEER